METLVDKNGTLQQKYGPQYTHFTEECLLRYAFQIHVIAVDAQTMKKLSGNEKDTLKNVFKVIVYIQDEPHVFVQPFSDLCDSDCQLHVFLHITTKTKSACRSSEVPIRN